MFTPSDSYKLNALINEEKDKIKKLYIELGEMYFYSHIDCYEEVFEPLMSEISLTLENLNRYEEQLVAEKRDICCPECKSISPANSQFCTNCGKKFSSVQPSSPATNTTSICQKCGLPLPYGTKFCTACGTKVVAIDTSPSAPTPPSATCPKCGELFEADSKFCTFCGTKRD